MKISRRTRGVGVAASVTASALALGLATSAHAVVPTWKTTGYTPSCAVVVPTTNDAHGIVSQYIDKAAPTVVGLTATPIIRVNKTSGAPNRTFATIHAMDVCSGLQAVVGFLALDGVAVGTLPTGPLAPADGNYFDVKVPMSAPLTTSDVGKWTYPSIIAVDRFEGFTLSGDHKTMSSPVNRPSGDLTGIAGTTKYAKTVTWVLRDTTMGALANHTSIAKGGRVYVSGTLKVSNGTSYVALGGTRVYLQRLYAGGKWGTVSDGLTSASGAIKLSYKPTKTARFRLVYTGRFASPWNAPRTTGTVKVTVK